MSKKMEKEPVKQNETKQKVSGKKVFEKEPAENNDERLKKFEEEIIKLKNDKLLLLAEIENKRKDFQRQMEYVYKYGSKSLIARVLNFLVDLEERALKSMRNDLENVAKSKPKSQELVDKFKEHLTGMEIIKDNLKRSLEDQGIKEIEVELGKSRANSREHELIEEVENDNLSEGIIVEVVEKGYYFHEEVLRPTKVKITKKTKIS